MKFIDEATIKIYAGDGGNGVATFRREKYEPMGGPSGVQRPLQQGLQEQRPAHIWSG